LPRSLPEGIPPKPQPDDFERPVAWLFGRQFIATLKYVLLYMAFKGKLDSRDWMKAEVADIEQLLQIKTESLKEFWWDYISDSGDGQKAVYSISCLCMSDLIGSKDPKPGDQLDFLSDDEKSLGEDKAILPRGSFLFVGGDTSYHISDYGTLANRFQNPFWWAFNDLRGRKSVEERSGLLFGIPGNHDYYDSLDGFNRQFRRPSNDDEVVPGQRPPLLKLPTFIRTQEASYVALHLPFDWWFWGLDTEEGEIDFRQLEFFTELQKQYRPKKLIVATPEPTIGYGKLPKVDANQSKTFAALGLERPVFKEPLPPEKCRVDLAGDIHHYARYFGPAHNSGKTENYTCVMAGGGGAFFHPTQTNAGEVPQQFLYPRAETSRNETAKQLFKVINIWKGGYVKLFGFLIAFALVFTAYFPPSAREAVDTFPPLIWLRASPAENSKIQPTPGADAIKPGRGIWTRKNFTHYLWTILFPLALGVLGASLFYSNKLFKKEYDPFEKARREIRREARKVVEGSRRALVWIMVGVAFVALASGLLGFRFVEDVMPPYGRSLIILAALLWAGLAVLQSVIYSEWLFEECYYRNIKTWHYWPIWVLLVMCVVELGAAFWFFGTHEAAYLIADLVQIVVILGITAGLIYFAVGIGGHLQKGIGTAGFFVLGASHALLQLAVPFLLVRKGHLLLAPFVAFVIVGVFQFIGSWLAKSESGWWLAIGWVAFGAALLITPFVLDASMFGGPPVNNLTGGRTFLLCFYAGVIGAVMSCALFGWYLAVALAFNGHNNEAGGAARIEGFKHLIRFRLNQDGLTGYVIAIDKAGTEEKQLIPKIVDVFHIANKP